MTHPPRITRRNIVRIILLTILPWLPAYLFERIDFYFGVYGNSSYWYYQLSGTRLEADVVSFALGGILVAYLLRPRWDLVLRGLFNIPIQWVVALGMLPDGS